MSYTIEDALRGVSTDGEQMGLSRRRGLPDPPLVLDGLKARRPATTEGLHVFTPEEVLDLNVDDTIVNGKVTGYQRGPDIKHARKIAAALSEGKHVPLPTIALDGHGKFWVVDGQHRAMAAVIARTPIPAYVERLTKDEQAELFFNQRRAKTVDPNVLILAGRGPFERYVQGAVAEQRHPWSEIASANRSSKTRIGPFAMYKLIVRYVANVESTGGQGRFDDKWDVELADGLAPLISCFGNKQTNAFAFKPANLQAVGSAAMWVFRRHVVHSEDRERWQRHMPTFSFTRFIHVTAQRDMTGFLVEHWNKKLSENRRVVRG